MRSVFYEELFNSNIFKCEGSSENKLFKSIETDSRKVRPGDLFWALKGETFDGHDFIRSALEKGAQGLVLSSKLKSDLFANKELNLSQSINLNEVSFFYVEDTIQALQDYASLDIQKRKSRGQKIIGITGSSGKTTTKEFAFQILKEKFKVHSNKGSFNNHFGVPFNILSAPQDLDILIVEMGMNHKGEITRLCEIANPTHVICTMVGTAHIEHFGSIDKIAEAKYEIYESAPQAVGVFNKSNPWTLKMAESDINILPNRVRYFFSESGNSHQSLGKTDVTLQGIVQKDGYLLVQGRIGEQEGQALIPIFGAHHVTNIMAAATLAFSFGMLPEEIWKSLTQLKTPWGRTQLLKTENHSSILFDAYNANPESMSAFLDLYETFPKMKKKGVLLGEMLELGDKAEGIHNQLGHRVALLNLDFVFFVGPSFKAFEKGYLEGGGNINNLVVSSTYNETLAISLSGVLEPESLVFVKGSRGMHLEKWVSHLKPLNFEGK